MAATRHLFYLFAPPALGLGLLMLGACQSGSASASVRAEAYQAVVLPQPVSKCSSTAGSVRQKATPIPPLATNWCWAASGQMAMDALESQVSHLQCEQANQRFARNDCCNPLRPSDCEMPAGGIPPLKGFESTPSQGALTPGEINEEICVQQRPFLIVLPGTGGGSHMVIAIDYESDDQGDLLVVYNPWKKDVVDQGYLTMEDYNSTHTSDVHDFYQIRKVSQ